MNDENSFIDKLCIIFFTASVSTRVLNVDKKGAKSVAITNNTSLIYLLDMGGNPVLLHPFSTIMTSVEKDKDITFSVKNM